MQPACCLVFQPNPSQEDQIPTRSGVYLRQARLVTHDHPKGTALTSTVIGHSTYTAVSYFSTKGFSLLQLDAFGCCYSAAALVAGTIHT